MEGIIPLVYRTIRRKKTRSYYKCLSTGTGPRFGAEFEARNLLLPPAPQKLGGDEGFNGERRTAHRRHRSSEGSPMKHFFKQGKPCRSYSSSSSSVKVGSSPRIFSCIGC